MDVHGSDVQDVVLKKYIFVNMTGQSTTNLKYTNYDGQLLPCKVNISYLNTNLYNDGF